MSAPAPNTDRTSVSEQKVSDPLLWFGVLAPPIAWAVRLMAGYLLVYVACDTGSNLSIHLVSLVTSLVSIGAGFLSWQSWQRLTGGGRNLLAGPRTRPEFMALTGVIFSVFFLAIILLEWSTTFFLNPCVAGL